MFARDEDMLCRWATTLSHKDFRFVLDTWRLHADPDQADTTAEQRYDSRSVHMSAMLDGMGRIDGTLDPEGFALVREATRALSQPSEGDTRTAAQRRADGMVTMARIVFESVEPTPGRKRRKPKVVATIDYDDLVAATSGGALETDLDRTVVPAETIRRIACDASVHRLVTGPQSTIVDYGRSQRVVSDSLFDVLAASRSRLPFRRVHHHRRQGVMRTTRVHWLDGGETEPDNVPFVCWHHHHWLHEQHWSIEPLGGGHFILIDPRRRRPPDAPTDDRPRPRTPAGAARLTGSSGSIPSAIAAACSQQSPAPGAGGP